MALIAVVALCAPARAAVPATPPRLAGTVVSSAVAVALFQIQEGYVAAFLGEEVENWRVESVTPGRAVLSGPDGRIVVEVAAAPPEPAPPRPTVASHDGLDWRNPCGRFHGSGRTGPSRDRLGCHVALASVGAFR